ncbi:alpha-2-macroglobulin family protein [Acuticoccus sp. M5D2P5]|uniref:alpha-2-macroglobulin family protein n=1 Tax=Acuticoccus kalidii TaxID=2910977 RepID=UPI001F15B623|nr:alpha-2-macroglobulin family protein [Acuticoccus kalidii]MCF3932772.1 alpha-2-macroglobulin family protein [Acuticoccus kalidii]
MSKRGPQFAAFRRGAWAVLVLAVAASPALADRSLEMLRDFDLPGGDYQTLREVELRDCQQACLADSQCGAFTYNERARWCFLKSGSDERVPYKGATSAVVIDDAPAETLPLPDLAFLPSDIVTEATRLEAKIGAARSTGRTIGLINASTADQLAASRTADWLAFAERMLNADYDAYDDQREAESLAAAAGYLGIRDATSLTEQARALAVVSSAMEKQGLFRPAIEAAAASLVLNLDPGVEQRLERLRAEHGFRVLDYSVDTETASPRMCVQFSETLQGDASDLERFVVVDMIANPTVSVDSRQLCVEGLEHGARYQIALRDGVPSTVGETLQSPANFRVYVRDRSPLARFESNRFVLPASAEGIPVTTINTETLDMALYRINDRNLASVVRSEDFKRQLWSYETETIADERGSLAWTGEMSVRSDLNKEVTTLFPLDDVLSSTEPGVYILTARPAESADDSQTLATQWFVVSDIGVSTYSNGGTVDVFVRSLRTAEPSAGVEVALLARNEEVLATGRTDAEGHARLASTSRPEGGLTPTVVTASSADGDYAFIPLVGGAFELTDRGVAGRAAPGPIDAFLATERGVYRAGETVHLTTLVRDDGSTALPLPVTIKLTRPDGVLSRRITQRADTAGGFALDLPLTTNAATGTWQVSAHIDPKGPAVGTTTFLVEDFVPQRIEVALTSDAEEAVAGGTLTAELEAKFLYGAPASDLMIEGGVTLRAADGIAAFPGYRFGLDAEPFTPRRAPLFDLPRTDAEGKASIAVPIADVSDATGALEARIALRVREPGGRTVEDTLTLPVATNQPMLGIKPLFDDNRVGQGSDARFEVIALTADRTRATGEAEWTLTKINRSFQWYRRNDRWFYEAVERLEEVASGTVDIAADTPGRIAVPVDWGQYRLEVADAADPHTASSMTFYSGWMESGAGADTPDVLEVHLDKDHYAAGDTATLSIAPRYAGTALVTVMTGDVQHFEYVDVPESGASVPITVVADWSPGAYVSATLVRPAGASGDDRPLPQRAVGIAYLNVDTADRRLDVAIDAPDMTEPRQSVTVPVSIEGIAAGETAYLTLAAVDVGILNITGYTPPDVDGYYLGQRQLAVELRDLYGDLINGFSGTRGSVRSGGDGMASGTNALPPNEEPVSLFSGLVATDGDGKAEVTFDVPAFNGTLRLMAIAWTETKVGDSSADMIVRDPVVLAGSLPRFLAPNDSTRMRFDLHNVSGAEGTYTLTIAAEGPLVFDHDEETLDLAADERASIEMPIAATGVGTATLVATLTGPDGSELVSDYTLAVRPAASPVSNRRIVALSPGEATTLTASLTQGFDDDAAVSVSVGSGETNTAGLLRMLDRFPYGCAEQTVSRALPLLYLNEVAASIGLDDDEAIGPRIEKAIERVLAFQSASGGFGLWSPGYDLWLSAYVMDFFTRAREAGYEVPSVAFESGLDRLQSVLSYVGDVDGERGTEIAYATYVLARNGRAAIGDLRYFAEEKLDAFVAPLARAQLAASLSLAGDAPLARTLFQNAVHSRFSQRPDRMDYGTPIRDAAAIVTLAAESNVGEGTVADLSGVLSRLEADDLERPFSTQEAAWLLLATHAAAPPAGSVSLDGTPLTSPLFRELTPAALRDEVVIRNDGRDTVSVATTVSGTPLTPLPPTAEGLSIERAFFTLDGAETTPNQVPQNTRLLVRLTLTKTADVPMRIMLTDLLPAGFEIENPRLVSTADIATFPMAQLGQSPEFTEFRDDRFAAAWTLAKSSDEPITVTYMVRAVSPGTFTLPAAEVSDMYQPRYVARTAAGTIAVVPTR